MYYIQNNNHIVCGTNGGSTGAVITQLLPNCYDLSTNPTSEKLGRRLFDIYTANIIYKLFFFFFF